MITITQAIAKPYSRPFLQPQRTRYGLFTQRQGLILELQTADHGIGYGEAVVWPGFTTYDQRDLCYWGSQLSAGLTNTVLPSIDKVVAWVAAQSPLPSLRFALEAAVLSLWARFRGTPLAQMLATNAHQQVRVAALVSDETGLQHALAAGIRCCKVKIASNVVHSERVLLQQLLLFAEAFPGKLILRLDANGIYNSTTALAAMTALADLQPEYVEQPLPPTASIIELAQLRQLSAVPLAVDESATTYEQVCAVVAAQAADVVVLKPMFIGSLIASVQAGLLAQMQGIKVVVTHALDSAIGCFAAASVAAALANHHAHGLAPVLQETYPQPLKPWFDVTASPPWEIA